MIRRKKSKTSLHRLRTLFGRRYIGWTVAGTLLIVTVALTELRVLVIGPPVASPIGWIIDGNQLDDLVSYIPSGLPKTFFGNKKTTVLKPNSASDDMIPGNWKSHSGIHYTSLSSTGCSGDCSSLQADLASNPRPSNHLIAMYDDEHWDKTPVSEQKDPCGAMKTFTAVAHAHRLSTIVAPDQNLGQPGVISYYQGGESENWQTYLRLGLGACAAASGSEWYHIMSQPFEAHWCGNPLGKCQSSESDFVNFVTQASLQARAVNPDIKISDGLSTSPRYFGYFRGAATLASVLYRDYADVRHRVNAVWMNIVGLNGNSTTLYFLSMVGHKAPTDRRSSVLFLKSGNLLGVAQTTGNATRSWSLSRRSDTMTLISRQTIAAGNILPAGTGEFQFWTDGLLNQSAKLGITFGYCDTTCHHRVPLATMAPTLHGNERGAAVPAGAFTTVSDITLPTGGPYHLYAQIRVVKGSNFNLLFGSNAAPTNIATPVLLQQ